MTRVRESDDTKSRDQKRLNEKINREKQRSDKEDFARLVSTKQERTAKANKDQQLREGKSAGQQAQAQNKLAARQGIQSTNFQEQLQKQGEQNLGNKQLQSKSRGKEAKQTRSASADHDAEATKERISKQGDKLAAISRDDRHSGRGDKEGGKEMGSGQQQPGGLGLAHADGAPSPHATATQQAQTAQAGHIPPEVIQQIVERVLVGVNKEGLNEFHIEFKENVLAGSSLRLTAKDGKISAKFSTHDVNVKRLLKASEGPLARAFGHKGLTLERFEVEGP
ncbi:hypothetical protein ACFL6C_07020 [Myxococcota bacterium]